MKAALVAIGINPSDSVCLRAAPPGQVTALKARKLMSSDRGPARYPAACQLWARPFVASDGSPIVGFTDVFSFGRNTRYPEEPLAASSFVRIAGEGGQSRRERSSIGATPPWCISPSLSLRHSSRSATTESFAFQKRLKMRLSPHSRAEPIFQSPVCMGRPAAAVLC